MHRQAYILSAIFVAVSLSAVCVYGQAPKSKPTILDVKTKLLFDVAVMRNQKKPFVVFYYSSRYVIINAKKLVPIS